MRRATAASAGAGDEKAAAEAAETAGLSPRAR